MTKSKKIGIMGGTFDPIHIGHMIAAEQAREQANLDEVWFIPTHYPPHKNMKPGASPIERLEMVQAAVEDHADFRAIDIEIRRGGISYTYDTIIELNETWPDYHFSSIIGADMVEYLPQWNRIEQIAELISFIGLSRPGYTLNANLPPYLHHRVKTVEMPALDVSSTEIRQRLKAGQSIRYFVPDPVYYRIREKQLYV